VNQARSQALAFLALAVLAGALRFPALGARPMHADEAVHADKLGTLLEGGGYAYDPVDYHGPTLPYLSLAAARLQGARRYVELDEATLRSVPAAVGTLLVAAHALGRSTLGVEAAAFAALLAAVSPAMVFFSRYYIHEMLLVASSFGALVAVCAYLRRPRAGMALAAGACAGFMLATKETAVIALASLLAGVAAAVLPARTGRGRRPEAERPPRRHPGRDAALALAAAAAVAALSFSSFLTRPAGLGDAVRAAGLYVERATTTSPHVHPWHYYLGLVAPLPGSPVSAEALIVALAGFGGVAAFSSRTAPGADPRSLRLLVVYTLAMAAAYSAIPYKTPWCLLGFLHGAVLLAGVGAAWLLARVERLAPRTLVAASLALVALLLGRQAVAASGELAADPRNPYVYGHTSRDVFAIVERLERLADAHPAGRAMPLQVVSRDNVWPLPWYLRRFTRVEWWTGVSDAAPLARVVVATPDVEAALVRRIYDVPPPGERELFVPIFDGPLELRPGVELRGYAAAGLWDSFRTRQAAEREAREAGETGRRE
jgi:uncharacterized protein (TIGR03663 family)